MWIYFVAPFVGAILAGFCQILHDKHMQIAKAKATNPKDFGIGNTHNTSANIDEK